MPKVLEIAIEFGITMGADVSEVHSKSDGLWARFLRRRLNPPEPEDAELPRAYDGGETMNEIVDDLYDGGSALGGSTGTSRK
jgi:hypothetical protein